MKIYVLLVLILISLIPIAIAEDEDIKDIKLLGLELEKLISLVNGLLSTILFVVALIAYKRDGRKRILFVSIAFLLFAIKNFLVASELFIPEIELIDPLATILEFAIILTFFFGVLKK